MLAFFMCCCRPESAFLETISYFPMVYWMIGSIEKYVLRPCCITLFTKLKTKWKRVFHSITIDFSSFHIPSS